MIDLREMQGRINAGENHVEVIWDADRVTGTYRNFRAGVLVLVDVLVWKDEVKRGLSGEVYVIPESRAVIALSAE